MRFYPNHYAPCQLWMIKHVARISPSIFSLFSGGGGGEGERLVADIVPFTSPDLFCDWPSSLSIRCFWGKEKREVKRGGERPKGEKQLSLLPLPPWSAPRDVHEENYFYQPYKKSDTLETIWEFYRSENAYRRTPTDCAMILHARSYRGCSG